MYRQAIRLLPRATATPLFLRPTAAIRVQLPSSKSRLSLPIRGYASSSGLTKDDIRKRILEVMKGFEKIEGKHVEATSTFTKDLGLDSLDAVEVVMAIEEEFAIEIPDAEADEIMSVGQAIDYIAKTPEAR